MTRLFAPMLAVVAALATTAPDRARAADADAPNPLANLCAPCHGDRGVSVFDAIPHLAGQQREYLIAEMKAFRRATDPRAPTRHWNRRREPIMDHQLLGRSDIDIESLAAFFAEQACPLPKEMGEMTPPKLAQRCISCHGDDGISRIATVPYLAGQQQEYLENQLRAFRESGAKADEFRTRVDPIMGHQSVTLSDADIVELGRYFSGRRCR